MANIFDFIPAEGAVVDPNAQQGPSNVFDSIPATSNVFDGIPINSDNPQSQSAQLLANILHPPIINPALGVHQPGMFSSGFSAQPPSLQNADDWGFTATILPKLLNNAVTRTIGTSLNAAGQAIKGGVESDLFKLTGQPDLAAQETIATIAKIFPQLGLQTSAHDVDISDPYEDARQTLPAAERIASGIGPGLIQSAPQMALTAVQPELGAASFGFTPQGFDPVQAAAMMIAPAGRKMIGGMAENFAAKAGISDAQALDLINRVGGGAGVASLISTPVAYQILQMKTGQERDAAIQDAASNAILTGILGAIGARDRSPETPNARTVGAPQNAVSTENASAMSPSEAPVSEKIDGLAAAMKDLQDMLRGSLPAREQQMANSPPDQADQIIRNVFPVGKQPVADNASNQHPNSDDPNIAKQPESTVPQTAAKLTGLAHEVGMAKDTKAVRAGAQKLTMPIGDLRAAGMKDAHHVIQNAAVKHLPGYDSNLAPGVQLPGPATTRGTRHNIATLVQRQAGGGTYAAERRIGFKALRQAGYTEQDARQIIKEADAYFGSIGVWPSTPTRIPANRR